MTNEEIEAKNLVLEATFGRGKVARHVDELKEGMIMGYCDPFAEVSRCLGRALQKDKPNNE